MGATLVDALDTMIIMKLHDEVKLASQFIAQLNFDRVIMRKYEIHSSSIILLVYLKQQFDIWEDY